MNNPPSADELCRQLADAMRPHIAATTALVGIQTGGVWVAEWLHRVLGIAQPLGAMDISFHRDDYHRRGLQGGGKPSTIPFAVEGAHIVIVDDVLHTGRTVRAALNELFDYGRPARVDLAVLADRGGRELPIAARWCPHTFELPAGQNLELERAPDGSLAFKVVTK